MKWWSSLNGNELMVNVSVSLWDYLSCEIQFSDNEKKACQECPFWLRAKKNSLVGEF